MYNQNSKIMAKILTYASKLDEVEFLASYVLQLGKKLGAEIEFLFTLEILNYPVGIPVVAKPNYEHPSEDDKKIIREVEKEVIKRIDKVKKDLKGTPPLKISAVAGRATNVVDNKTSEGYFDFIVLSGSADSLYMINERNMDIVKRVHLPVLLIPEGKKFTGPKLIVYATDYKEEDIPVLRHISEFASNFRAGITALHITDDVDFEEKVVKQGFKQTVLDKVGYNRIEITTMAPEADKDFEQAVNDYAKSVNADMIAALRGKKGFIDRVFRSSATRKLINAAELPVLVYQEE
jgi:nucleotide-binding universal stress UspA family protein